MFILFLIVFIDLVGFGLIIPLLPFYAEYFQASPLIVGLIMATYSLFQFAMAPVWGHISDHRGRRPVLLLSLSGAVAAYALLSVADTLWMLFLARALGGAMAGNIATAFAYVADITTAQNRAKGMGLIGAAFGLGFIFGPAIGGILAGNDPAQADYATPSLAAAGFSLVALVLTFLLLKESVTPEQRASRAALTRKSRWRQLVAALTVPAVGHVIAIAFLSTFVFASMETTFAMWSRRQFGWGPEQNGYLFAFVGFVSALIQGAIIGPLATLAGEARLVRMGAATLALGLLAIPFSAGIWSLLAAMLITAGGFSLMSPALNSLLSQQVSADVQGATMGVSRSATTLARVAGPVWGGFLFEVAGKDWPFYAGGVLMMAVVVLALIWLRPGHGHSGTAMTRRSDSGNAPR